MAPLKGLLCCFSWKKGKGKQEKMKERKKQTAVGTREPYFRSNSMKGVKSVAERTKELTDQNQNSGNSPKKLKKTDLWKENNSTYSKSSYPDSSFNTSAVRLNDNIRSNPISHKIEEFPFKKELEFAEAKDLMAVLQTFSEMCEKLSPQLQASTFDTMFPFLRQELKHRIPNKYDKLLQLLETRAACKEYGNNAVAAGKKVVILGAGPCGLRLAMETQLLGADTTVLEARKVMNRNNVLKLWPFVMEDLKSLGAKMLYQKLEHGSINHISIWMLQLILVKLALLLGAQVRAGETYKSLVEPKDGKGWVVVSERMKEGGLVLVEEEYDIVLCATGRKVPLEGFDRNNPETKMSIAITANWKNLGSAEELAVEEIPGLSWQNNMDFFKALEKEHGISLENIVHFKDKTHYFVMTAKKESLVKKGVILTDTNVRDKLLHCDNIDKNALTQFAQEAATFSTGYFSVKLPSTPLEDQPSIFDFTHLYRSKNACKVMKRKGHLLLLGLVGDSLMQPFWPEGLGISRGFLSVLDAAWMVKRFCMEPKNEMYEVIQEREKLYALQKTADNQLKKAYKQWTINPITRYPSDIQTGVKKEMILDLFDTDEEDKLFLCT